MCSHFQCYNLPVFIFIFRFTIDEEFFVSFPSPPVNENPDWVNYYEFGKPWTGDIGNIWANGNDPAVTPFDEEVRKDTVSEIQYLDISVGGIYVQRMLIAITFHRTETPWLISQWSLWILSNFTGPIRFLRNWQISCWLGPLVRHTCHGVCYHVYDDSCLVFFLLQFHFILNVAVGGTNGYIPDGCTNGGGGDNNKPWANDQPYAPYAFYQARETWLPTWNHDNTPAAMEVDYIRVWQKK